MDKIVVYILYTIAGLLFPDKSAIISSREVSVMIPEERGKIIGEKIKRRRIELGMTQQELAARAGTTKAAISHYEVGRRVPRTAQLVSIAAALDLSPCEFIERDVEPTPVPEYFPGEAAVFDEEPPEEESALERLNYILRIIDQETHLVAQEEKSPTAVLRGIGYMISDFKKQFSALIVDMDRAQSNANKAKAKYDAARRKMDSGESVRVAAAEKNPLIPEWHKLNQKGKLEAIKRVKELSRLSEYALRQSRTDKH